MTKEQALEILIKLANEVALNGANSDLRIKAIQTIVALLQKKKPS